MLSKEEALQFVSKVLEVSSPLEKVAQDPHQFLKEYMSAFLVKIPFQSASLNAIEPSLRHRYVFIKMKYRNLVYFCVKNRISVYNFHGGFL